MHVDKVIPVDRPFEVIQYIPQPYIVKVQRPVHVPVIKEIPIPQPIYEIEPIIQNDIVEETHHAHHAHHGHGSHGSHGSHGHGYGHGRSHGW